jgi:LPS export ABC transporter protein LptC
MKKKLIQIRRMIPILGIVLFVSCENNLNEIKMITDIDKRPTGTSENIAVNYTTNGKIEMKLFAPILDQYTWDTENPYNEFTKGLKVLFYNEAGELQSTLKADYAKYYVNKKLWEARNNVEMINPDGDKLTSDLMYADENTQKMYSTKYVKITSADGTEISGEKGFISNFDFTEYNFKDVSGIVNIKEK